MAEKRFADLDEKEVIKLTRHKAEVPLKVIAVTVTLLVFALIGVFGILATTNDDALYFLCDLFSVSKENSGTVRQIGFWLLVIEIVYILVSVLVIIFRIYKQDMTRCVRVTKDNFPELYDKLHEYCYRLGIREVPKLYIVESMDEKVTGRVPCSTYIRIARHDFEIAMNTNHFEIIYLSLAQCVGHVYFKQSTISYQICSSIADLIPIFSHALNRAMYYSADRVAQVLAMPPGSSYVPYHAMCGKLSSYVDEKYVRDFMKTIQTDSGERLCCFLSSLFSYKPFAVYRLYAYTDPERKSGKLF